MEREHDDMVDALKYAVQARADPAALAAMVATTGVDLGLKRGVQTLSAIGAFGGLAAVLAAGSPRGGWFVAGTLFVGVGLGMANLLYRRWGQTNIARTLLERPCR